MTLAYGYRVHIDRVHQHILWVYFRGTTDFSSGEWMYSHEMTKGRAG